jgi:hypothetical protein
METLYASYLESTLQRVRRSPGGEFHEGMDVINTSVVVWVRCYDQAGRFFE